MALFTDGVSAPLNYVEIVANGVVKNGDLTKLVETTERSKVSTNSVQVSKTAETVMFMSLGKLTIRNVPVTEETSPGFFQYWGS